MKFERDDSLIIMDSAEDRVTYMMVGRRRQNRLLYRVITYDASVRDNIIYRGPRKRVHSTTRLLPIHHSAPYTCFRIRSAAD